MKKKCTRRLDLPKNNLLMNLIKTIQKKEKKERLVYVCIARAIVCVVVHVATITVGEIRNRLEFVRFGTKHVGLEDAIHIHHLIVAGLVDNLDAKNVSHNQEQQDVIQEAEPAVAYRHRLVRGVSQHVVPIEAARW